MQFYSSKSLLRKRIIELLLRWAYMLIRVFFLIISKKILCYVNISCDKNFIQFDVMINDVMWVKKWSEIFYLYAFLRQTDVAACQRTANKFSS